MGQMDSEWVVFIIRKVIMSIATFAIIGLMVAFTEWWERRRKG